MSTEARWLIREWGGGGGRERVSGSSVQSDPQKTEEAVDHHREPVWPSGKAVGW